MKKIVFILPWLELGGLERMQVTLANALSKKGYSVTVITTQQGDTLASELDDEVEFIYREPKKHIGSYIPYIRHKFYDDGMWETRATPKKLHDYYIGKTHYDIEVAFFRGMPVKTISGGVARKKRTTISMKSVGIHAKPQTHTDFDSEIVVHLAWVHTDFEKAAGYRNNFKSMREVFNAYQSMDHVICVSNQAKEGFKKVIGDTGNLKTIYNMLPVEHIKELSKEKHPISKNAFTVLSVGHFIEAKGFDRLISAAEELTKRGYSFEVWILGYGTDENKLKKQIEDAGLKNVKLLPRQMNPYPYMRLADLYVCSSRYEGFNLTVAEALICGCAVMSTECAGPVEILNNGEYGMIVENSQEGIYNGLKKLMDCPEIIVSYKEKAVDRGSFFAEDKILPQIEELFR